MTLIYLQEALPHKSFIFHAGHTEEDNPSTRTSSYLHTQSLGYTTGYDDLATKEQLIRFHWGSSFLFGITVCGRNRNECE